MSECLLLVPSDQFFVFSFFALGRFFLAISKIIALLSIFEVHLWFVLQFS